MAIRRLLITSVAVLTTSTLATSAVVQWNVDSNGDWNIGSNWDTGTVPMAGDDVTVDRPSVAITVTQSSGNTTVSTMTNTESYSLMGGSFTVNGPSTLEGTLTLNRGTLAADGSNASFVATGPANISNGTVAARNGATVQIQNAAAFQSDGSNNANLLEAVGIGSQLLLPNLAAASSSNAGRMNFEAEAGGTADLSALTTIDNPNGNLVSVLSAGMGSQMNMSALQTAPAVRFTASDFGTIDLGQLSFAPNASFSAQSSSHLALPQLTALSSNGDVSTVTIESNGGSAVLDLSSVSLIQSTDTGRMTIEAEAGGLTDLSAVTQIDNPNNNRLTATSTGVGSHLDFSSLATTRSISFTASQTATIDLAQLTSATNSSFSAQAGSALTTPLVTAFTTDGSASTVTWEAVGPSSRLDFGSLTRLDSTNTGRLNLEAENGGVVDLSGVTTINNPNNNNLTVLSTGGGSQMDLGNLAAAQAVRFTASNQGTLNLSALSNATNSSFAAGNASQLALPQLASFITDGGSSTVLWEANGFASRLEFPALNNISSLTTGRLTIEAEAGGVVGLNNVTTIGNSNNNNLTLLSTGGGSHIDLSRLTNVQSVKFNIADRGTIDLGQLTIATNSGFTASAASELTLPQLGSFITDGGASTVLWEATGIGSRVSMPALSSITSVSTGRLTIEAEQGGTVDLSALTSFNNPNNNNVTVMASGANSNVDLSMMTTAQALRFTASQAGVLDLSTLTVANNSGFVANGGSELAAPQLSNFTTDGGSSSVLWEAAGFSSQVNMPALTTIASVATGRLTVETENGGLMNLSNVANINNPNNNNLSFTSTGFESRINLSGLTAAQATKFIAIDQGSIQLDQLNMATNGSFEAQSGAALSAPALATFVTDGGSSAVNWRANGFGSDLTMDILSSIESQNSGRLTIEALDSGQIALPQLTNVINPNANNIVLRANGFGSVVTAPVLTQFGGKEIDAVNGGRVALPNNAVTHLTNTKVTVRSDGSRIEGQGLVFGDGSSLIGDGSLSMNVTNQSGKLDPGAASVPGTLTIDGDFAQQATGEIEMDISLGADFDFIHVTGSATIAGVLDLDRVAGTNPDYGDTFQLLQADNGVSGTFDMIEGVSIDSQRSLAVVFNADSITAVTVLPGDANADGSVDGQDFIAWNNAKFSTNGNWGDGDFNGDGSVDGQDFIIWNDNKFQSVTAFAVPEPTGVGLIAFAILFVPCWHRGHQSARRDAPKPAPGNLSSYWVNTKGARSACNKPAHQVCAIRTEYSGHRQPSRGQMMCF